MDKSYVLIYQTNVSDSVSFKKFFESALDMDEFINSYNMDGIFIEFCGKIEQEIKYQKKYVREVVKKCESFPPAFPPELFQKIIDGQNI